MIIIIYIYRYEDTWHIYEDWILYSFSWPLASGGHGIDKVQPKIIVNAGVLFTRLEMMRPMSGTCQEFDAADHLEEELRCLAEYGGTTTVHVLNNRAPNEIMLHDIFLRDIAIYVVSVSWFAFLRK